MIVGDGVPTSRQRGGAALGDGFPRQCAHGLGMTGAKRRCDVGIAPYGMTENGADDSVRPYKRTVKGHR